VQQHHVVLFLGTDTVTHKMSSWSHPSSHLGVLDEVAKIRVVDHDGSGNGGAVCGITSGLSGLSVAEDDGLDVTLDTICTNEDITLDDLTTLQGDGGSVSVDGDDGRLETEGHIRGGEIEEELVEVGTVNVEVVGTVLLEHLLTPLGVAYSLTIAVSSEDDAFGLDSDVSEGLFETPAVKETGDVGGDLDTGADLTDCAGGFDHGDSVAGLSKGMGGGETTEATSYDQYMESERRLATFVELNLARNMRSVDRGVSCDLEGHWRSR